MFHQKNISMSNESEDSPIKLLPSNKFSDENSIISRNTKINVLRKPKTTSFYHFKQNSVPIKVIKSNSIKKNLTEEKTQTQFNYEIKNINIFSKESYSKIYNTRYSIPKLKKKKNNILNNAFLKSHFNSNLKVNDNILKFKNPNKKYIVTDDISLIGSLLNQTTSNFNNKYKLKYWTSNKRKKEQITYCFNLLKKGMNLKDIDILLNGPKEIISYQIEKNKNNFLIRDKYNINVKKNKVNNVSVNTLEFIRPYSSLNKRINFG